MAPRRLVLAMLLLLAFSTIIALMAPDPSERGQQESEPQTATRSESTPSDPSSPAGPKDPSKGGGANDSTSKSRGEEIDGSAGGEPTYRSVRAGEPVRVISVRPNERVILEVRSSETIEISIPELGRVATADRWAPAIFDLVIPLRPGAFEVVGLRDRRPIARLVAD